MTGIIIGVSGMPTDKQFERLLSMTHKKQFFYQLADAAGHEW